VTGKLIAPVQKPVSLLRRHVARRRVGPRAEEMVFHLAQQVLARARVGEVEAVFIHQHGLVAQPVGPGLLAHLLENALADGVQAIYFEYGTGPQAHEAWQAREIKAYTAGDVDTTQDIRALRYAVLLATANNRMTDGMESNTCARWVQAGGDSQWCHAKDGRLYQLVANELTLRNLVP